LNTFKRFSNILIAVVIFSTMFFSAKVESALYVNGPEVDLESINVSKKEVGPNEKVTIRMKITDEHPIDLATVTYKSQLDIKKVIVLSHNQESGLYEGSLTIEDHFDSGEWTLHEISVRNSLNEKTLIYANYVKDDSFRKEDLREHSFHVSNTNPVTIDMSSFSISTIQQYDSKLDLSFRINNPHYLREKVVTVGYLGPKEENSIYPNIEYFQLHVDGEGFVRSGARTPLFTDKYELGEWKLISISLPIEDFGDDKILYDLDYVNEYNPNFSGFGIADLSTGDFILQKKRSGTPLIDLSTLHVEKDVYTAGETVKISVKPLEEAEILDGLSISYRYPNSNQMTTIGGYYDLDEQKYILSYPVTAETQTGEWIIDNIDQQHNGSISYIYNNRWYGENHYDLNSGNFTIIEDILPPAKPEVTEITDQTTEVKGTAEPGSKVVIKVNDVVLGEGITSPGSEFTIGIPKQKAGTILAVFATDASGNISEATIVTVTKEPQTGWIKVNTDWYYFDATKNAFVTGWMYDSGKWYYLKSSGAMATGWVYDSGKWYYLLSSGAMATGWTYDSGKWYYLKSSGVMATGWIYDSGNWYYLKTSGVMATGWIYDSGEWYYLKSSGVMATGWINVSGKWYYLYNSGQMAYSTIIGGYHLGSDGVWRS
jgi:hypothetical protein